jgi:hypothetical protein
VSGESSSRGVRQGEGLSGSASSGESIECRACEAGLPLVWHVQSRRTMHEAQGLSVVTCKRIEARERRQRDIANDRGNEDQRGR